MKNMEMTLEQKVVFLANLVYGYQGSDTRVQEKQVGIPHAAETLKNFIEESLAQRDKENYQYFIKKHQLVTYKKDGGHGIAVPFSIIIDRLSHLETEGK